MKRPLVERLKSLKKRFRSLPRKEREGLSVCFLKVKLAVNSGEELKQVKEFLGDFRVRMNEDNLDHLINYLHAEKHSLPEFIALEESITEYEIEEFVEAGRAAAPGLKPYDAAEIDTLREPAKPFR